MILERILKTDIVTLDEIESIDSPCFKSVAYHILYSRFGMDTFYKHNPIIFNTCHFMDSPVVCDYIIFRKKCRETIKEELQTFIKEYPCDLYVNEKIKQIALLLYFGILSEHTTLIEKLLNTRFLNYNIGIDIVKQYSHTYVYTYDQLHKWNFDDELIYNHILSLNLMIILFNYNIQSTYKDNISTFDKRGMLETIISIYTKNKCFEHKISSIIPILNAVKANNGDQEAQEQLFVIQKTNFSTTSSPYSFYDVLMINFKNKKYDECITLIKNHQDIVKVLLNNNNYVEIMCVLLTTLYDTGNDEEFDTFINKYVFNDIMITMSKKININFTVQRPEIECRLVRNVRNEGICLVCLDNIKKHSEVILCLKCNRYIGCYECVIGTLNKTNKCIYCRQ